MLDATRPADEPAPRPLLSPTVTLGDAPFLIYTDSEGILRRVALDPVSLARLTLSAVETQAELLRRSL